MTVAQGQQDLTRALFEALDRDGFTTYCFGPRNCPNALAFVYEWPDHYDVILVPQQGSAAAARLAKPADVLDPPDNAVWTWVGDPELTIWALLRLPHPEHPDAPAGVVPTPEALRIPRESQRLMNIRKPPPGKAGVRAERLMRGRDEKDITQDFFRDLFAQVDSAAAIGAAENFTEDGEFQFGNLPAMTGYTVIAEFVEALFKLAAGVKHELYNFWKLADRTAFTNGMVTFTRHDLTELVVPFATVSQFNEDCTLLIRHQVYVDASALMSSAS